MTLLLERGDVQLEVGPCQGVQPNMMSAAATQLVGCQPAVQLEVGPCQGLPACCPTCRAASQDQQFDNASTLLEVTHAWLTYSSKHDISLHTELMCNTYTFSVYA